VVGRAALRRRDRRLRRAVGAERPRGDPRPHRERRALLPDDGARRGAKELGWRAVVADARGKFATPERIPSADELLVDWPEDVLARVQPDEETAIVVLTHEDRFDIPALRGALETDAFYIGALGARRNQARRRERLLEQGVSEEDFERISGPSGLDIGAHSPAETAVSILAEILAVRARRSGGRLKESKGRIHAEVAEQRS
jgi:xanthine dehydrogenase accessory factor